MNTVQIMGFLGKDPVIRATQTGRAMANMSVAVNRTYTDARGNRQELTDWVEVVAWGNLAEEVYNHLKKGSYVYIEGRYSTGSYIGKDGTRKYSTKVMANVVALPLRTRLASTEGQQPMGNGIAGNGSSGIGGRTGAGIPAGWPGNTHTAGSSPDESESKGKGAGVGFNQFIPPVKDENIPF